MLADTPIDRSAQALGPVYEHPEAVSDDTIAAYLSPLLRTESAAQARYRREMAERGRAAL